MFGKIRPVTACNLPQKKNTFFQAREAAELYRRFFNAELWFGLIGSPWGDEILISINGGTPKWLVYFMENPKKIKWKMTRGYPYLRKSPNIPFWCPKMGEISQSCWHLNSKSDEESCGIGVLNFTQSISSCGFFWGCRIGKVNILHIK